jgi:hypothetical protein
MWVLAVLVAGLAVEQPPQLDEILRRVSEEAEVFVRVAPATTAEETLKQRALRTPPRFRPRIGDGALKPPPVRYQTREIVSEYGYAAFADSPNVIHEFRQVISVDGRRKLAPEKARQSLSLGIRSADDRVKKRMLLDFEKHGLIGTVTDFGQLILLFTRRRLEQYRFAIAGTGRLGADPLMKVSFAQTGGTQSLTVFEGRQALHQRLRGEIWVRIPDLVPVRITLDALRQDGKVDVREEAAVDYIMSPHGVVLPAAVVHRQYRGGDLVTENVFRYAPFRRFSAESEVKFTEVPLEQPK